jgi:hypothetical protein
VQEIHMLRAMWRGLETEQRNNGMTYTGMKENTLDTVFCSRCGNSRRSGHWLCPLHTGSVSGCTSREIQLNGKMSARGGDLGCRLSGDRVFMSGSAVEYLRGEIDVVV